MGVFLGYPTFLEVLVLFCVYYIWSPWVLSMLARGSSPDFQAGIFHIPHPHPTWNAKIEDGDLYMHSRCFTTKPQLPPPPPTPPTYSKAAILFVKWCGRNTHWMWWDVLLSKHAWDCAANQYSDSDWPTDCTPYITHDTITAKTAFHIQYSQVTISANLMGLVNHDFLLLDWINATLWSK